MINALYLFYINGRLLIQRHYRQVANKSDICQYINKYIKTKKIYENPIIELNDEFFINVVLDEIAITVMTKSNSNICLIYNFIYKFIDILNYFFNNDLSGLNVVNNFALIYEICDEIIDYGYPQNLEINILKNHVINKVKYYNKTSKYFQNIANELPFLNNIIEDIIEDARLRSATGDTTIVKRNASICNGNINNSICNNTSIGSNNIHNLNHSTNKRYYSKDVNLKHDMDEINMSAFQEKSKLKHIGKETLNKIKNKIIHNNSPINTISFINGNCTWRNNNIYYKKNVIYMDITEILNVTINSNNLIHAHINGKVTLKCLLSGMPVCELCASNKYYLLKNSQKNGMKQKMNSVTMMKHKNQSSLDLKNGYDDMSNSSSSSNSKSSISGRSSSVGSTTIRKSTEKRKKRKESKKKEKEEVVLENCTFHNCATLTTNGYEKIVTFTPPDGSFELMKYTITKNIQIPFQIIALYSPLINYNKSGERKFSLKGLTNSKNAQSDCKYPHRYEYTVTVRSNLEKNVHASDVVLKIPIYKFSENIEVHYKSAGKVEYNSVENIIIWKIKKFLSNTENTIKMHLTLENRDNMYSNVENIQKIYNVSKFVLHAHQIKNMNTVKFLNTYKLPITMSFQIPMYTCSGTYIRYLKIFEKSSYKVVKWIKYTTDAGIYQYK